MVHHSFYEMKHPHKITLLLNLTAATAAARNLNLVMCYDVLLEFVPETICYQLKFKLIF